jgi:hypothetical protein
MDSSLPPRICRGCGYPYVVDDTTASHMDPPDDYRRGFKRFCIGCWVGMGTKEELELFSAVGQPERAIKGNRAGGASDAEIQSKPKHSNPQIRAKSGAAIIPPKPSVYLWLCCEGLMRFGPFEWLRYDESTSTISDSSGNVIAWKERARWFVPSEYGSNMAFDESYMITTTPQHPDPSNRNLPDIRPMTTH